MAKIAVSYRRSDTKWITGRIVEHLKIHFGRGNVFMDLDNIPLGLDYRNHIREILAQCDVLVAVVGPKWQEIYRSRNRWTDDSLDWVRLEISTALERKIPVVPLLIDGAKMPKANRLPDDLRDFAFRQATTFDSEDFDNQIQRLIKSLAVTLKQPDEAQSVSSSSYPNILWTKEIMDPLKQADEARSVSSTSNPTNLSIERMMEILNQAEKPQPQLGSFSPNPTTLSTERMKEILKRAEKPQAQSVSSSSNSSWPEGSTDLSVEQIKENLKKKKQRTENWIEILRRAEELAARSVSSTSNPTTLSKKEMKDALKKKS
jgi:hypothetical protein